MHESAYSPRQAKGDAVLVIDESDNGADMYYATGFLVPDPFTYLELGGEKIAILKDLELGRAKLEAAVDRIVPVSRYEELLREAEIKPTPANVLKAFLDEEGCDDRTFAVAANFPVAHADALRRLGFNLKVKSSSLFPERAVKTKKEIEWVHTSQQAAEGCMTWIFDQLAAAKIGDDEMLHTDDGPLHVEDLRRGAQQYLLGRDCVALSMIIAPGDQGCDPHLEGSGHVPANRTIIVDIFPRSLKTRYWGDITRTPVRGKASDEIKALYRDVLETQEMALAMVRPGVDGQDIHTAVQESFEKQNRPTEERDGQKVGYFHGTGHGVGLDIHEAPSLGRVKSILEAGHTITVEPGLYYPGLGAVRIEDTVLVTDDGYENLTVFPKDSFEI